MITIPTSHATAILIADANPEATVVAEQGRMSVVVGPVEFVATIPAPPLTAFPHGYLSRRSS